MHKVALIAVDVQEDRMPNGPLGQNGSDRVVSALVQLSRGADIVIASQDILTSGSACIRGTKGARLVSQIRKIANYVVTKGDEDGRLKNFSAFQASTLRPLMSVAAILEAHEIDRVQVGGLYLDGAVGQTAFDANALAYDTTIPLYATMFKEDKGIQECLDYEAKLRKAGIFVV